MQLTQHIIHEPFSYRLGPLTITGFGLGVLAAFVIAQIIAQYELERRGHETKYVGDMIFAAVIGGLLGAKLYYTILMGDWSEIFSRAGFVYWGGLIGGTIAVLGYVHFKKIGVAKIADVGGICVAAAYSLGRTGCWAVGDDYGRPWNSRFAVEFPDGAPASTVRNMSQMFGMHFPDGTPLSQVVAVYPTQIFEVTMGFIMFLILWKLRDHKHAEGWLFGVYCVLAGIERFIIEFFRAKDDRFFGMLTTAQLFAIMFFAVGLIIMYARRNITAGKPGIYAKPVVVT